MLSLCFVFVRAVRVIIMLLDSEKIALAERHLVLTSCVLLGCFRVELYKRFFYTNDLVFTRRGLLSSAGSMD